MLSVAFFLSIDNYLYYLAGKGRFAVTVNMLQIIQPNCEMSYLDIMILVHSLLMMYYSPIRTTHILKNSLF